MPGFVEFVEGANATPEGGVRVGTVNIDGSEYQIVTLARSDGTLVNTTNALPVQSKLVDENGVAYGVKHIDNKPRVSSIPYLYDIAKGLVPTHDPLLKFGTRMSVAAATQSVVWEGPTALYVYMATAQQLKVTSTSAEDSSTGTGIRTLIIYGLDANFAEINETITMNGLTAVTTTKSFLRVYRAFGVTCGTSLTNVGTISIKNNAETVTQVIINPNDSQTLMTLWTVPAGKVAYLTSMSYSNDSGKGARISLFTRLNDGGALYPWLIKYRSYAFQGDEVFTFNLPFKIPAKTDIEIRVTTPASAGTTSAGATFELWYEDV